MTTYSHIQMSKESNAMIYVVPTSEVCNFLDELIAKGIDISKSFLLKTTTEGYTTKKAYFRNNSKFGRTTQLILNDVVVAEFMGTCTLKECLKSYNGK